MLIIWQAWQACVHGSGAGAVSRNKEAVEPPPPIGLWISKGVIGGFSFFLD